MVIDYICRTGRGSCERRSLGLPCAPTSLGFHCQESTPNAKWPVSHTDLPVGTHRLLGVPTSQRPQWLGRARRLSYTHPRLYTFLRPLPRIAATPPNAGSAAFNAESAVAISFQGAQDVRDVGRGTTVVGNIELDRFPPGRCAGGTRRVVCEAVFNVSPSDTRKPPVPRSSARGADPT